MLSIAFAGGIAGLICGILGAGGGMVLVPLLGRFTTLVDKQVFSASVLIMLPICAVSLLSSGSLPPLSDTLPYLLGSSLGGIAAGLWGSRIPTLLLHRGMGALILLGALRILW